MGSQGREEIQQGGGRINGEEQLGNETGRASQSSSAGENKASEPLAVKTCGSCDGMRNLPVYSKQGKSQASSIVPSLTPSTHTVPQHSEVGCPALVHT